MGKSSIWDLVLAIAEFAYNDFINWSKGKCPFEVVYRSKAGHPIDLVSLLTISDLSPSTFFKTSELFRLYSRNI